MTAAVTVAIIGSAMLVAIGVWQAFVDHVYETRIHPWWRRGSCFCAMLCVSVLCLELPSPLFVQRPRACKGSGCAMVAGCPMEDPMRQTGATPRPLLDLTHTLRHRLFKLAFHQGCQRDLGRIGVHTASSHVRCITILHFIGPYCPS